MGDTLHVGDELGLGQSLQGGACTLTLQDDGNPVLPEPGGVVWATNTHDKGVQRAVLQEDGNLVLYTGDGAVWATDTNGKDADRLVVQAAPGAAEHGEYLQAEAERLPLVAQAYAKSDVMRTTTTETAQDKEAVPTP
ncbi:LysM peptidoglycan-binding domain-containing protein [Streptomyces sp. XH2]|uniref:LysM peptidoglycan-binding domain-containing protein n=1 Tax=Streptomyces sp. XH2 TaxID=3412483 RepID=UPI003C7A56AD